MVSWPRAQQIGETFKARLGNLADEVPAVGEVRIIGAMAALEFVTDRRTKEPDLGRDLEGSRRLPRGGRHLVEGRHLRQRRAHRSRRS